jgi:hypothetical protein
MLIWGKWEEVELVAVSCQDIGQVQGMALRYLQAHLASPGLSTGYLETYWQVMRVWNLFLTLPTLMRVLRKMAKLIQIPLKTDKLKIMSNQIPLNSLMIEGTHQIRKLLMT